MMGVLGVFEIDVDLYMLRGYVEWNVMDRSKKKLVKTGSGSKEFLHTY
jgi:hypothetical protein